ncbi:MAG TPA: sodium:solute symporter, partial [Acetobacteraceae bacterium]|nr:sodium:solute symporter [Acetobacteraceae bacterium]
MTPISPSEIAVCLSSLALVVAVGISARWWRRGGRSMGELGEWGLAGRQFGTWITWFLLGGDFYTAYTIIAVPALVYSTGAAGFFALPYTIVVYPVVFAAMPALWRFAHRHGCITAADVVQVRYGSRGLALAVAVT